MYSARAMHTSDQRSDRLRHDANNLSELTTRHSFDVNMFTWILYMTRSDGSQPGVTISTLNFHADRSTSGKEEDLPIIYPVHNTPTSEHKPNKKPAWMTSHP